MDDRDRQAWETYLRAVAEYNRQIERIERAGGRYGPTSRPRPPTPPHAHPPAAVGTTDDRTGRNPLGTAARVAVVRLIAADAANGAGPFVIVRPNGTQPLVAKGQFREEVSGRDLLELERAGVLLENTRDSDDRLKSFYLASDTRQRLAKLGSLRTSPRIEDEPQSAIWPEEARGMTRRSIWAAYDELVSAEERRPTRARVAEALYTTESTLERAQKDLGIPGWPPPRRPIDRI